MSKVKLTIEIESELAEKLDNEGIDCTELFLDAAYEKLNKEAVLYPEKESVIITPEMMQSKTDYNSYKHKAEDEQNSLVKKLKNNSAGDIVK